MTTTYTFYRNDQKQEQFEFHPSQIDCLDEAGFAYFGRVLNQAYPQLDSLNLDIFVTAWTVKELPRYGKNVVSVILQDEWGRLPVYRNHVGAVFKTCGLFPYNTSAYGYGGPLDWLANFLGQSKAFSKDHGNHLFHLIKSLFLNSTPMFQLPLGYYANANLKPIPFLERQYDVFFAGSIEHKAENKVSLTFPRPKTLARQRMSDAIKALENYPHVNIKQQVTGGFAQSINTDNDQYLATMMNSKFCPIPRGANLETFRFYEAIRYGCIPVGEAFPSNQFYDNAPIVRLSDWSDLPRTINELLENEAELIHLHKQSQQWWNEECSEASIANYFIRTINKLYPNGN